MRENLNEKSSLKEGYKIQLGRDEYFDLEDFVMTHQRFNKGSGEWNKVRREVAGGNPMLVEGLVGYPGCGGILEFVGYNPFWSTSYSSPSSAIFSPYGLKLSISNSPTNRLGCFRRLSNPNSYL